MVEHYMNEQDSEDIQREHSDLQRQYEELVAEDQAQKIARRILKGLVFKCMCEDIFLEEAPNQAHDVGGTLP